MHITHQSLFQKKAVIFWPLATYHVYLWNAHNHIFMNCWPFSSTAFPPKQICKSLGRSLSLSSLSKNKLNTYSLNYTKHKLLALLEFFPTLTHIQSKDKLLYTHWNIDNFPSFQYVGFFVVIFLPFSTACEKLSILITVLKWSCNLSFKWTAVWMPGGMLPGEFTLCLPLCLESLFKRKTTKDDGISSIMISIT